MPELSVPWSVSTANRREVTAYLPCYLRLSFAPLFRKIVAMKSQRLACLTSAVLVLLGGCAAHEKSGSRALVGTWTNSVGTVWTIKPDGMFDVDLDRDGKRDGWGKWSVRGDTVTFVRKGGVKPKGCEGKGIYHFSADGANSLKFTLVEDDCRMRVKNVTLLWKRK